MKYSFLAIIMVCALGASAQVNFDYITSTDTLTNAATYYVTLGKTYTQAGTVECGCTATNLSGTTAATALIQVSHSPAGTNFVDANTDTLTIANGTASVTSATLNGYKARLKVVGSGTQSTKIVTGCTYKKAN